MEIKDSIIIGGGPAGMTCALNLLRLGKSVLLIEKEMFGGQIASSPRVENIPSIKSISGLEYSNNLFEQICELGVEFDIEEISEIKKENNTFEVIGKYNTYYSKSVILANGVSPRQIGVHNELELRGKGVSYCAVCDGAFYQNEDIVIVGDANTALQYAVLLAQTCNKVYLYTLFDKFFADEILVSRIKKYSNIIVKHNVSLTDICGENEVEACVFKDTKTNEETKIDVKAIFVAIGQVPNNDRFSTLVDLENGFILTNDKMETKTTGLYAIGDTRKKSLKQVVTAQNDGSIAAFYAANYIDSIKD